MSNIYKIYLKWCFNGIDKKCASTYERRHVRFVFLNLANFIWDGVIQFHYTWKWQNFIPYINASTIIYTYKYIWKMFPKVEMLEETKGWGKEEKNDRVKNNEIHLICVEPKHNENCWTMQVRGKMVRKSIIYLSIIYLLVKYQGKIPIK
jgi:hypothetical protein